MLSGTAAMNLLSWFSNTSGDLSYQVPALLAGRIAMLGGAVI